MHEDELALKDRWKPHYIFSMRHNVTIFATYGERTILVSDESVIAIFYTLFSRWLDVQKWDKLFNGCKLINIHIGMKLYIFKMFKSRPYRIEWII